ncbi:MAG: hypothetical protein IT443_12820 [Phycisphaeraceae bacterium]|nr:hypothetical protein [Phycisphaeraceae bacterium]
MPTKSRGVAAPAVDLQPVAAVNLAPALGQCRAAAACLGPSLPRAILLTHAADFDVDPYINMFFFPTDTLKIALLDEQAHVVWQKDLGRGVVPGMWFCPVYPFDLDGDGVDEIYYVDNVDPQHPLSLDNYRLTRLDGLSGQVTGQWPWPRRGSLDRGLSQSYRNFILGGYVRGQRVLVTAQGTYTDMYLQGWNPDLTPRWEINIPVDSPGARGSHMCPVLDLDGDGVDELLWGERCLSLADGREKWCADRDTYRGHSDVIQPIFDEESSRWFVYAIRESAYDVAPRVALYDDQGRRIWGQVDKGHMDMGWTARLDDGRRLVMAIRISGKTCGPDGRFHSDREEFLFDARTGAPATLPFDLYQTMPVDLNGDGGHEFVRGIPGANGQVIDRHGQALGSVDGTVPLVGKFLHRPGEQILSYRKDGLIRFWADRRAQDSPAAQRRYAHPFYAHNLRAGISGSNYAVVAGV